MLKRFYFIAVLISCLCLVTGCNSQNSNTTSKPTSNDSSNSNVIDLGDTVLFDTDRVTAMAHSIYEKNGKSYVTFTFKNKTDRKIHIFFDVSLDDRDIKHSIIESSDVSAGKTGDVTISVYRTENGEQSPILPIEDILTLNGKIESELFAEDETYIDGNTSVVDAFDFRTIR